MSAVISACGRDAASPATATLNLASPKQVTDTCDSCWSSAPTMSSGHTAKTQPCEDGVSAWVPVAEAMREDEPWWPSPESLPSCCIESGSHRRSTCYAPETPFYPAIPQQLHSYPMAYSYSAPLAWFYSALDTPANYEENSQRDIIVKGILGRIAHKLR